MGTYSIYKIQLLSPCLNSCFAISETISSSVRFYLRPLLVLDSQYLTFIIAHVKDHFNLSAFSPISLSSSVTTWFECKMSPTDLWVKTLDPYLMMIFDKVVKHLAGWFSLEEGRHWGDVLRSCRLIPFSFHYSFWLCIQHDQMHLFAVPMLRPQWWILSSWTISRMKTLLPQITYFMFFHPCDSPWQL